MFPTAAKNNDKKRQGSLDASESEDDYVGDESPIKQHARTKNQRRTPKPHVSISSIN